MKPYYSDDAVTIYHGDCREVLFWDLADAVMVTDPPYGRGWKQGRLKRPDQCDDSHAGIAGDADTTVRDAVLAIWGDRPAVVFGDLMLPPPPGTRHVLIYRKPPNAGTRGAMGGFRRDAEAIYLMGDGWPSGLGGKSSVIATSEPSQGNPSSPQGKWGHPHVKPHDVMCRLIEAVPLRRSVIVDPFMGTGSTLRAAKDLGHVAIGVEVDANHCRTAVNRMAQEVLDFGAAS